MRLEANNAITELIQSKDFKQCIQKVKPEHLQEDLASEVYLALLETKPEKIVDLQQRNELRFYAVGIIWKMTCSNTSPFHTKFRQYGLEYRDNYDRDNYDEENIAHTNNWQEVQYSQINLDTSFDGNEIRNRKKLELLAFSLIDNLYWYDAMILKLYLQYGDYRSVAKETRIPFMSIYCTAKKAINSIKAMLLTYDVPHDKEIEGLINKIEKSLKVDLDRA